MTFKISPIASRVLFVLYFGAVTALPGVWEDGAKFIQKHSFAIIATVTIMLIMRHIMNSSHTTKKKVAVGVLHIFLLASFVGYSDFVAKEKIKWCSSLFKTYCVYKR